MEILDSRNYLYGLEDYSPSHTVQSEGDSTPIRSSDNERPWVRCPIQNEPPHDWSFQNLGPRNISAGRYNLGPPQQTLNQPEEVGTLTQDGGQPLPYQVHESELDRIQPQCPETAWSEDLYPIPSLTLIPFILFITPLSPVLYLYHLTTVTLHKHSCFCVRCYRWRSSHILPMLNHSPQIQRKSKRGRSWQWKMWQNP